MEKNEATTKTVAKINDTRIILVENGEKLVPIKPICEALGVDFNGQSQRIQRDEILNLVTVMTTATGRDKKQREMLTIPLQFVFGWLFTIQTDRVKPEAREALIQYKLECYNALWKHFTAYQEYVEYRQDKIDEHLSVMELRRKEFSSAKDELKEAQEQLN